LPLTVPSKATARRDPWTWPNAIVEPVRVPATVPAVMQLGWIVMEPLIADPD
jgi:hypothetical protein